jgi:DNA repair exonuclease SbcCD ATPase subunit
MTSILSNLKTFTWDFYHHYNPCSIGSVAFDEDEARKYFHDLLVKIVEIKKTFSPFEEKKSNLMKQLSELKNKHDIITQKIHKIQRIETEYYNTLERKKELDEDEEMIRTDPSKAFDIYFPNLVHVKTTMSMNRLEYEVTQTQKWRLEMIAEFTEKLPKLEAELSEMKKNESSLILEDEKMKEQMETINAQIDELYTQIEKIKSELDEFGNFFLGNFTIDRFELSPDYSFVQQSGEKITLNDILSQTPRVKKFSPCTVFSALDG